MRPSAEYQAMIEKAAYTIGRKYGLKDSDFIIRLRITNEYDARIRSGSSSVIRIDFAHLPGYKDFWPLMIRTITAVSLVKKAKPGTAIDTYIGLKKRAEQFDAVYGEFKNIAPVLKEEECEIEVVQLVRIKHKETKVVVTKECRFGKITDTVIAARLELTDLVTVLKDELAKRREAADRKDNEPAQEVVKSE